MKEQELQSKILSILVPVYNTEKYIRRCLDSVLVKEVLDDIEIIVVSDGSKDSSASIVKEYAQRFPSTVKLIEKENGGHGSTINKGLEVASGKYFKVLDSDDWFNILDLVSFVGKLKQTDCDLVLTDYAHEFIYEQRYETHRYSRIKPNVIYHFDDIEKDLIYGDYFMMATSTYKTAVLRKSGMHLMEKTFYVDMQYDIEPVVCVDSFTYYSFDIYRYYIGRPDQSVSLASMVRRKKDHEKVVRHLVEFYEERKSSLSENKMMYIRMVMGYMLHTHYAIFCAYDPDKKTAASEIRKFDTYLKQKSPEIYSVTNNDSYIRAMRKSNFKFIGKMNRVFNTVVAGIRFLKRDAEGDNNE